MRSEEILAYTIYAAGVASPGPSNMAIAAAAMSLGRRHAVWLAAGVLSGSMAWGLAASVGLASMFTLLPSAFFALKAVGGLYLLWLACKSARAAMAPPRGLELPLARGPRAFARGAAMHLTNPQAVLTWMSIMALAAPVPGDGASAVRSLLVCALIGAGIFGAYALVFSTGPARRASARVQRVLHGGMAALYGYAGVRLLRSLRA